MNTLLTAPDIEYLRGQQMKLDGDIIKKNGITHDEWMEGFKTKHYLALKSEIHEFINECHDVWKYWKSKPINSERIIDEAVDIIHFVILHLNKLTVSNEVFYKDVSEVLEYAGASTELKLGRLSESNDIHVILGTLLSVLNDYNFTTQDILDAYNRKNAINFERLEGGY